MNTRTLLLLAVGLLLCSGPARATPLGDTETRIARVLTTTDVITADDDLPAADLWPPWLGGNRRFGLGHARRVSKRAHKKTMRQTKRSAFRTRLARKGRKRKYAKNKRKGSNKADTSKKKVKKEGCKA